MFYSSEDVPKAYFFLPRSQTKCLSLFQPWVALQCGCYNHSICLILRVQIWHKTQPIKDFLNPGNEWSGGKQWRRMVRAVWLRGHPAVCSLVEKAPGDGKQNLHSEHQNTPNPPPFSHWKKKRIGRHKFNWLIKALRKELAVNWLGRTKQTRGEVSAWLARTALRFQPDVTSLKMCFFIAKRHMLYSCHIV